jgi:hypothetical protein
MSKIKNKNDKGTSISAAEFDLASIEVILIYASGCADCEAGS